MSSVTANLTRLYCPKFDLQNVVNNSRKRLDGMLMVSESCFNNKTLHFLGLYSGKLRDELPLGPGTLFKPEDNSNLWKGTFMGQKSNGISQWSFGM